MNLFECLDIIESLLATPENKRVQEMLLKGELNQNSRHLKLGTWVRNTCKMWTDGIDEINEGILATNNKFNTEYEICDNPDDVSGVVLDIYVDMKAGKIV